jgi:cytochrome c oxidase subunit 4
MAHAPGKGHDEGAVQAHVSSPIFYGAVFSALLVLTITTVGQWWFLHHYKIDLGAFNVIIVILIATLKASLVVAFFMHLRWDNKFNALIFISCIFFVGVFFAYTLNDTEKRGELDGDQNVRVLPKTGADAPGGFEKKEEAHGGGTGAGSAAPTGGGHEPAPPPGHH